MASLSIPALRCGGPGHLPQSHVLKAGPFSMLFEQGELRRIRLGDREVIRRIYLTVRGPDWSTIPGEITDLTVTHTEGGFDIHYTASHRKGGIDFTWVVDIRGNADGWADWVLVVCGYDLGALHAVSEGDLASAALASHGAATADVRGIYGLAVSATAGDVI